MVDIRTVSFGLNTDDVVGLTEIQRTAIEFQLCISVASLGTWKYWNFRYPRWKNAFGYAQIMSGAFVVETIPLNHINQELLHWRDDVFGINETVGCYAKALATLINNGALTTNTVLTRQRYTSVRFKFFPGVLANAILRYEVGQPVCGGNILPPDPSKGVPPNPLNHSHDPSTRPSDQGGDPSDPTNNDGDPTSDPNKQPPTAELYPPNGVWFIVYSGLDATQSCAAFSGAIPIAGATDPNVKPIFNKTQDDPCPGTFRGEITYKGQVVSRPANASSISFVFQPQSNP